MCWPEMNLQFPILHERVIIIRWRCDVIRCLRNFAGNANCRFVAKVLKGFNILKPLQLILAAFWLVLWSDPVEWSDPMIRSTHWNSICTQILLHRNCLKCWFCVSLGHVFVRRCFYYFIIIFIITFFWLRSDPWSDPMIWSVIRSNDSIQWSDPMIQSVSRPRFCRPRNAGLAMRTTIKIRYIIFIKS